MKKALILTATAGEGDRLKIMLHELGFAEILTSADEGRAVMLAENHLPEVAIVDVDAVGDGWLNLLKLLRAKRRLPVILLGGGLQPEAIELGVSAGAGGFLAKPLRKEELWPAIEIAAMHDHELEELQEKVARLEGALEGRKTVEKAKGVLMRQYAISEPDAFRRMQKLAMDKRTTLLKIAEAILLTEGSGPKVAAMR
jgi:response regulator NasT